MPDIYLRGVPADADPDDVRLYDPTVADGSGGTTLVATANVATLTAPIAVLVAAITLLAGSNTATLTAPGASISAPGASGAPTRMLMGVGL
jgi:hypothetical protein